MNYWGLVSIVSEALSVVDCMVWTKYNFFTSGKIHSRRRAKRIAGEQASEEAILTKPN